MITRYVKPQRIHQNATTHSNTIVHRIQEMRESDHLYSYIKDALHDAHHEDKRIYLALLHQKDEAYKRDFIAANQTFIKRAINAIATTITLYEASILALFFASAIAYYLRQLPHVAEKIVVGIINIVSFSIFSALYIPLAGIQIGLNKALSWIPGATQMDVLFDPHALSHAASDIIHSFASFLHVHGGREILDVYTVLLFTFLAFTCYTMLLGLQKCKQIRMIHVSITGTTIDFTQTVEEDDNITKLLLQSRDQSSPSEKERTIVPLTHYTRHAARSHISQ